MRGRAIRIDAERPNKTSNIWHLACVDPTDASGGSEIELLKRRFEAFVGITNTKIPFITNGYERLSIPKDILTDDLDRLNSETIERSENRDHTFVQWKQSIGEGSKLTRQLQFQNFKTLEFKAARELYLSKLAPLIIAEIILFLIVFFFGTITLVFSFSLNEKFLNTIQVIGLLTMAFFGYKLYRMTVYYLRHGFLHKKLKRMGRVILETMNDMNLLTTDKKLVSVQSEERYNNAVVCSLKGASNYEEAFFLKTLTELLEPVKSPRYIIVNTNFFKKGFNIENFYPVPDVFGKNKEDALCFQKQWTHYMGKNKLIYTRQPEGRRLLLKARMFHYKNELKDNIEASTVWK